jgi:NTE family protein
MKRSLLRRSSAALLALALAPLSIVAQDGSSSPDPPRRPRIGLALGGGGARGAAHIGVLRVLEEMRIPIDVLAGTSMGSVVGGLYVVGYSPDTLENVIGKVDWADIFVDEAPRPNATFREKSNDYLTPPGLTLGFRKGGLALPAGLIAGRKMSFLLNTLTLPAIGVEKFDDLPIPYRAVAADARTGEPVRLSEGSLARAIRASMAIPIVFTPVSMEGRLLIDGGEAENLPVQTVRAMGADIVIAVDVASSSEVPTEAPKSLADVAGRLIDLPLLRNTQESRKLADIVITPDLKGLSTGDFPKMAEIIPRGEKAARENMEKLARLSVSPEEYAEWRKTHRVPLPEKPPMIDELVVDPIPNFDTRRIVRVIATKAGLPFNEQVLQADMRRIAGMGLWETVEFRMEKALGKNVLHIQAVPKSWGPTYLTAGLDFEVNASSTSQFGVDLLLDQTEFNKLGADWKTALRLGSESSIYSHFFQPVEYTGRYFFAPRVSWSRTTQQVFVNEISIADYALRQGTAGIDFGMELGHLLSLGEFSIGIERGYGKLERQVGIPQFPDVSFDTGNFVANLTIDQLDHLQFARHGYYLAVNSTFSRKDLGSDASYNHASITAYGAETIGRWTGDVRVSYGDNFNSATPFQGLFFLGGLFNLSGRPRDQLYGSTAAIGVLRIRYHLLKTPGTIVSGIDAGASAEMGNAWLQRSDASFSSMHHGGSVFLVTDTLAGPFYIAYGNSGNKNHAFYLLLNRLF